MTGYADQFFNAQQWSAANVVTQRAGKVVLSDNRTASAQLMQLMQFKRGGIPLINNRSASLVQRVKHNKYYTDKHFSFTYKKQPVYDQHIDGLVDGLDDDRAELEKYKNLKRSGKPTFRKIPIKKLIHKKRRNITEKVGELNATNLMNKKFPTARLVLGFGKGVGFDQVYQDGNEIIIVEAKGPGAKLGVSDLKGKQMSIPWVTATARGMKNKVVAALILAALKKNKLRRLVISSTLNGNAPKNPQEL